MFEIHGGMRNRARELQKKGSAFIWSSDHWTRVVLTVLTLRMSFVSETFCQGAAVAMQLVLTAVTSQNRQYKDGHVRA